MLIIQIYIVQIEIQQSFMISIKPYQSLILVLLVAATHSCSVGLDSQNISCSANCSVCSNYTHCTTCCQYTFLYENPFNKNTSCRPCTDPHCYYCYQNGNTTTNYCSWCDYYYGVKASNSRFCQYCTVNTSIFCVDVNFCNVTNSCAYCYQLTISNRICQDCNTLYRNCYMCNQTQCWNCYGGFYLNTSNYKECVPCNYTNCLHCTNGPSCYQCYVGYYLSAQGYCQQCRNPCIQCNLTYCFACENTTKLYLSDQGNCSACPIFANISGCLTCTRAYSSSNASIILYTCYHCLKGFFLNVSNCSSCVAPCLTCLDVNDCLSCSNNSFYLNQSTSRCSLCTTNIPHCLTCLNNLICLTCEIGFRLSQYPISCEGCDLRYPSCKTCDSTHCLTCIDGYTYNFSSYICIQDTCSAPCFTCNLTISSFNCLSCINGYYYGGSNNCILCDTSCLICLNVSFCVTCAPEYKNTNGSCQLCPPQQYYHPLNFTCYPCPVNCLTCFYISGCQSCDPFFILSSKNNAPNICVDICGDGFVMTLPCDSATNILNDGCTNECTIQQNYNCTYSPNTTSLSNGTSVSVSTSSCSFIGNITAQLAGIQQSIFDNYFQLSFSISPYLYGLPVSNDYQIDISSLFILSPVINYSISVDSQRGVVTFNIPYSENVDPLISLNINFGLLSSIPMFQYMSNASFSYNLNNILQTIEVGIYYSPNDRNTARATYKWAQALSIISLVFLFIGAISKELAGLEQVILCQTIFISLLFTRQKLPLTLMPLSGFRYSMGVQFQGDFPMMIDSAGYALGLDVTSFISNFSFNLGLYIIPIVASLIFVVYKLKNRLILIKSTLVRNTLELITGETFLYFSLFNFYSLVSFSFLFFTYSSDSSNYWSILAIGVSSAALFISIMVYIFNPKVIGFFRGAFRTDEHDRWKSDQNVTIAKIRLILSIRPCYQRLLDQYQLLSSNYYYLFISYMFTSAFLIIFGQNYHILVGIQIFFLVFLIIIKPYYNTLQKIRCICTFTILLYSTLIISNPTHNFSLTIGLLLMITIHQIIAGIVIIYSFKEQCHNRCNLHTQIIRSLFKQHENVEKRQKDDYEKEVLKDLIKRYQDLGIKDMYNTQKENIPMTTMNRQDFEDLALKGEETHLRFQKGMQFIYKYGNKIDQNLVKHEYQRVQILQNRQSPAKVQNSSDI